jgi:multidrug efflux pump subunit AcrB
MNTKNRRFIGLFPIDHCIRIIIPAHAVTDDDIDRVKQQLAAWYTGAVAYQARATWQDEHGKEQAADVIVIETHGDDARLAAHIGDVQELAAQWPGTAVEVNNRRAAAPETAVYTTEEAAEYLGISAASVKYHVYTVQDLHPVLRDPTVVFTREELDRFKATPRPRRGRPKRTGNA